jgi:hypothetical protein
MIQKKPAFARQSYGFGEPPRVMFLHVELKHWAATNNAILRSDLPEDPSSCLYLIDYFERVDEESNIGLAKFDNPKV